jgi:hypothetical protein
VSHLFHVSEEPAIKLFEPRPSKYVPEPVVWAIDEVRLRNYLMPRDCPRVTYYAGNKTSQEDVEQFLGLSSAVVAVESTWFDRLRSCQLYCYRLPPETFDCFDECAGYFVSRAPVVPGGVSIIHDVIGELLRIGVELRFIPNLWPLRDAVASSTLQFSFIRMQNAQPRNLLQQGRTLHTL